MREKMKYHSTIVKFHTVYYFAKTSLDVTKIPKSCTSKINERNHLGGILPNWGFSKHGEFNPALVSQKQNACRDIPASRLAVRWFATHLLLRVKRKDSRLPKLGTEVLVLKRLQTVSFGTVLFWTLLYSRSSPVLKSYTIHRIDANRTV